MKRTITFCMVLLVIPAASFAQDFITRGKIEFEIKRNTKKIYDDDDRAQSSLVASLPAFQVSHYELLFARNHMLYMPGRKGNAGFLENENSVYTDLDEQKIVLRREFIQEYYAYEYSVHKVKWHIENETRKIAGFECRKAIGRIHDSVYVVAFYCPEIVPQGGPECFSGLPGMILGLAIPRYYTTWFATRIEIANVDESKIIPPSNKKRDPYNIKALAGILYKKWKESGWWKDVTPGEVLEELKVYTLQNQ